MTELGATLTKVSTKISGVVLVLSELGHCQHIASESFMYLEHLIDEWVD